MTAKLERLLEEIDPSRTLDEVAARVDRAVNSFPYGSAVVTDVEDFEELIGRFYAHVEGEVLSIGERRGFHPELDAGYASQVLNGAYGPQGWKAAFEMARTGVEGGLRGVLTTLAERMAVMYARNEIGARVYAFWEELSPEEWLEAAEEYVDKFGHLLPSELTEGGAWRLKGDFAAVLAEHPFIIRRIRRVGR